MSQTPFKTFLVSPAYGRYTAAISWELAAGITGDVYFYRSESGLPGTWVILNPDAPATGSSGDYLDTTPAPLMFVPIYYRALVDPGGPPETWLKGPAITALDGYTRREYLISREILRREYRMMATHNGLPMFHYIPKLDGDVASDVDIETRQILGPGCPEDPDQGYGGLWINRFHPPVQSWAMIMEMAPEDYKIRPEGTGDDPESNVTLRMLAFPKPGAGHMIAFPKSDRRYVIMDPIRRYYLRGAIPLLWECGAMLLDRDDARYRIQLPELLPDPVSP